MFNPMVDKAMTEAYPQLRQILADEWLSDGHLDKVLRFMVMVYDPKSPLIKENDLNFRRGMAAELSGLDEFAGYTDTLYDFTHAFFSELVIKYLCRFVKSKEYAAIVIVENCFWESARKLMEPISGKDSKAELEAVQKKSAIKDELDKDIARLDKYYKAFFGDENLEKKARGRMTPEAIAKLQ